MTLWHYTNLLLLLLLLIIIIITNNNFTARHKVSRYMLLSCVCPSVCPSHAGLDGRAC